MKIELNTDQITKAVGEEISKLPKDKKLHMAASYGVCLYSEPFIQPKNSNETLTSIDLLKSAIDAFKVGLKKEYQDSGKDFTQVEIHFNEMINQLLMIYNSYNQDNINDKTHETDLLGDLVGIGLWLINQSMRNFNFHYWEDKNENIS